MCWVESSKSAYTQNLVSIISGAKSVCGMPTDKHKKPLVQVRVLPQSRILTRWLRVQCQITCPNWGLNARHKEGMAVGKIS